MNGITELAKLFKQRDNYSSYSPMFGKVISLPSTKIAVGDKIILTDEYLAKCFNLNEQDQYGNYVNIGKTVVMLPYQDNQKFILIGVIQ